MAKSRRALGWVFWLTTAAACAAAHGANDGGTPPSPSDAGLEDSGVDSGGVTALPPADAGPLGATLVDGGALFRVWAPNASAASAVGDFGSASLAPIGDGTFAGFAAGALSGQAYHYALTVGTQSLDRTDPRARVLGRDPGGAEPPGYLYDPSTYAWQSAPFVPPTPRHEVIYELHVATFVDPTGTGAGTYASAATKLADLAQLGINMVELMPVTEFPGTYSWGYNPVYPLAPVSLYGTPADLQAFVDQAHQLGIGVILDVVFNHYELDSRRTPSLSMWCFDGPCDGGGIYFDPEPSTEWGPRPAYGVPEVHDLIVDAVVAWLRDYRVDGFRWDSVVAIRNQDLNGLGSEIVEGAQLLRDANVAIHTQNAGAVSIAEDLQGWDAITDPVDAGAGDAYGAGYGFDTQWDDNFFYSVRALVTAATDAKRDVTTLVSPLTSGVPMQRVVYSEDHDKVAPQNGAGDQRIPALVGFDAGSTLPERQSGLGLALVLTAPATPMLFMGQEFLESLPFPFSPAQAIDWTNEQTYAGFRTMVHDLIALRENLASETRGLTGNNIEILEAANTHDGGVSPAIAYRRYVQGGPGDDVVVAANFGAKPLALTIGFALPGAWHVRFNSDDQLYSPAFGGTPSTDVQANGSARDNQAQSGVVQLGAYSVVILSQ